MIIVVDQGIQERYAGNLLERKERRASKLKGVIVENYSGKLLRNLKMKEEKADIFESIFLLMFHNISF